MCYKRSFLPTPVLAIKQAKSLGFSQYEEQPLCDTPAQMGSASRSPALVHETSVTIQHESLPWLTSITKAHAIARQPSPANMKHAVVAETLQGIRRTLGVAQPGKIPLLTADLIKVLAHLEPGLGGIRDRALLLVGYTGRLRRSEIAAFTLADLAWVDEGAVLTLRRSKTDQAGQGRKVAIPKGSHPETCPVTALRAWVEQAKISEGPLFRPVDRHGCARGEALHKDSVGIILKRAVARAGFNPAGFAGHSLRAGFATQAARNGASAFDIMRQTGHRSVATVSRYIREAQLFRDSPASKLGL